MSPHHAASTLPAHTMHLPALSLTRKISLGLAVRETRSAAWMQIQGTYATARLGFWFRESQPHARRIFTRRAIGHMDSWQINFWRFSLAVHWATDVWHAFPSEVLHSEFKAQMEAKLKAAIAANLSSKFVTSSVHGRRPSPAVS